MMYASWDIRHGRQSFLSFWAMFCPLTLLTTCEIKIIKNEKNTWRYYRFTLVSHKWWSYVVWFLRYGAEQTEFFVILCHFLPFWPGKSKFWKNDKKYQDIFCSFTPLLTPKTEIWKNAKNNGDIILLQMCTINQDHMMYGSWDIKCKGQSVLPFWAIFALWPS